MKYLKKTLSFVLAFAMAFTMVIVPRGSVSAAGGTENDATGSNVQSGYKYFPVNLYNYITAKDYTGSYSSDLFNAKSVADAKSTGKTPLLFNTGSPDSNNNVNYNRWSGKWTSNGKYAYYPYNGTVSGSSSLVEDTLDENGNIQFTVPEGGIFTNNNSMNTNGVKTKEYYTNVQMPFKILTDKNGKETGYYCFDSEDYDVYFDKDGAKSGATLIANESQKKMSLNNGLAAGTGFFPFDGAGDTTPTYHFGMNVGIQFYVPNDKTVNGEDMVFEFSGDDDVWVYVDGHRVLDLGGIHNRVEGKINFTTGYVTISYRDAQGTKHQISNEIDTYLNPSNNWNKTGRTHSLQVFYLERGQGASNCKIKCNLPQQDVLSVNKIVGNQNTKDEDLGTLGQKDFEFTLYKKTNGVFEKCVSQDYNLIKNNGTIDAKKTTSEGKFTLKFNERADFYGITAGDNYKVVETTGDNYTTTWNTIVNGKQTGSGKGGEAGDITIAESENTYNTYVYNFTNTCSATLVDDIAVLDYGKKISIDVLKNDTLFGATKKIKGIAKTKGEDLSNTLSLDNGNVTIESSDNTLTYAPTKYMNSVDTLTYAVNINNITGNPDLYANVNILPATSVYYDDDFGEYENNEDANIAIVWDDSWKSNKEEKDYDASKSDHFQDSSNKTYGWDSHYTSEDGYSDGTVHYSDKNLATAKFRFKGTGVDVYSRTNGKVGKIIATLKKVTTDENNKETSKTIKNVSIDNISESGDYYQIPTLNFDGLEYGTYEVIIRVVTVSAENRGIYYLDGIRVYNPLGNVAEESVAGKAYEKAGESNAQYISVRQGLLDSKTEGLSASINNSSEGLNGSVFIDKSGTNIGVNGDIGTYEDYGPKNEVYLKQNQGVAFKIKNYDPDKNRVFIGLKSPEAKKVTVKVSSSNAYTQTIDLNSTADLYYEIKPDSDGNVVIKNTTNNLLSVTKVRITSKYASAAPNSLVTTSSLMAYVDKFDTLTEKSSTSQKDQETTLDKDDVDINNPGDNKDNDENKNDQAAKPNSIWKQIINSIKHWFRR